MSVEPAMPQTPSRRHRWQWSLRTLLLLTAVIAAWTAWWQVTRQSERLRREIISMENVGRKLTIDDPTQFAVVKQHEQWYRDERWRVHLPPGYAYQLKFATRDIDVDNFPEAVEQQPIEAGRHEIEFVLGLEGSAIGRPRVLVDGRSVLELPEPAPDWNPTAGWAHHELSYDSVQQLPVSKPLVITRRRFEVATPGGRTSFPMKGPAPGVLLWIERGPEDRRPEQAQRSSGM